MSSILPLQRSHCLPLANQPHSHKKPTNQLTNQPRPYIHPSSYPSIHTTIHPSIHPSSHPAPPPPVQVIHIVGTVGRVEWRSVGVHPYTGIFQGARHGLVSCPSVDLAGAAPPLSIPLLFLPDGFTSVAPSIPNNWVSYRFNNEGDIRLYSLLILSTCVFGDKELLARQDGSIWLWFFCSYSPHFQVRFSLALEPNSASRNTVPGMGLKFLRDGRDSANLVAMYSGRGIFDVHNIFVKSDLRLKPCYVVIIFSWIQIYD